jgi:lipopolysaccharide exporter
MSIARRAASGAAWNLSVGVGVRVLGLVGTLVLTRFLAPAEYGEVAVAAACALVAARVATLGLGTYVIAYRTGPEQTFQAFAFHALAVGASCGVLVAFREPLSLAVGSPGMARYLPAIALALFLVHLAHVPAATLVRDLRFRAVSLSRAAGEIGYTFVSVGLAPFMGGAALVLGHLVRGLCICGLTMAFAERAKWLHPTRLEWPVSRAMLRFGLPMNGAWVATTVVTYGDRLVVSGLFGPGVMGEYNIANGLASTPTGHVAEHIGDVLLPSFAKVGEEQRRSALPRALGLMSLVVFPLATGLAVVAPTAVSIVLDPRWQGVAPMLVVLAAISFPHPLVWVIWTFFAAKGRSSIILGLEIFKLLAVFSLLLGLGWLGPLWACAGVALGYQLHGLAYILVGRHLEGLAIRPLLAAASRPLATCGVMAAAVLGAHFLLRSSGVEGWPLLISEILLGAGIYVPLAFVLARRSAVEALELTRSLLRRRGGE